MFNFWPFNVARKRREEAHSQAQERLVAAFREDCQQRAKRNKVIPMDDPRHPRNLSPQQRADALAREAERQAATQRDRYAAAAEEEKRAGQRAAAFRKELAAPYGVQQQQQPESVVREFRCDHPAISEFWQEQQARCDSPADTSSPSCDAPSSTD